MLLAWRIEAWGWLLAREILVAVPLAAGAAAITLVFRLRPQTARIYGIHLVGTAAGVAVSFPIMALGPPSILLTAAAPAKVVTR